ncbi:MAG TPA: hypothetical protein VJJ52_00925 [Candidatus Nanoarchaeia archaeon]|nr:hypothetical protein [Candidatus Nanoarchaeia archaeon]
MLDQQKYKVIIDYTNRQGTDEPFQVNDQPASSRHVHFPASIGPTGLNHARFGETEIFGVTIIKGTDKCIMIDGAPTRDELDGIVDKAFGAQTADGVEELFVLPINRNTRPKLNHLFQQAVIEAYDRLIKNAN